MFLQSAQPESHSRILPVTLALAPTLIGATIKWLQDNSKSKRRSQLSDRLTGVSKAYGEQTTGNDDLLTAARTALGAEISAICAELASLQAESKRTSNRTLYGWVSDAFLLFRPRGFLAWTVHLIFYCGASLVLFGLLGVAIDQKVEDAKYALFGFFLFGLVLLGLQRLAILLRKRSQTGVNVTTRETLSTVHNS